MIQKAPQKTENIIDFRTYCVQALNDSFPNLVEKPTLFQLREAKPSSIENKALSKQNSADWSIITFACIFLVFGLLFRTKANVFFAMVRGCFNVKFFDSILKNGKLINNTLTLPVFFLYTCLVALISERAIFFWGGDIGLSSFKVSLLAMAAIIVFSLSKLVLIRSFGLLFNDKKNISLYISNQIVYFALGVLLLIFPIFCSFYLKSAPVEILLYLSLALFALLSIIRALRGFVLLLKMADSFNLYLFLYLCTVEIVPLLIAIKILIAYI